MPENELITVEIAYALADNQLITKLNIYKNTNIKMAIEVSNILLIFPEIDLNINKVGVFGKICGLDTPLRHKDRVEIYRPLIIDPKKARVERAQSTRKPKKR